MGTWDLVKLSVYNYVLCSVTKELVHHLFSGSAMKCFIKHLDTYGFSNFLDGPEQTVSDFLIINQRPGVK